jgi:hypothetical protein
MDWALRRMIHRTRDLRRCTAFGCRRHGFRCSRNYFAKAIPDVRFL